MSAETEDKARSDAVAWAMKKYEHRPDFTLRDLAIVVDAWIAATKAANADLLIAEVTR